MAYIGTPAVDRFTASKAASVYSGNGSTVAFTLEHAVGSDEDILVSVDGVIQEPSVAYAVSVGTTLTFTAAPSSNSGNNIFVYYLFRTLGTVAHPATSALSATTGAFSSNATVGGTLGVTGVATGTIVKGTTSFQTPLIEFTDGDDAIAIADAGVITIKNTSSVITSEGGAVTTNIAQGLVKAWVNFTGVTNTVERDSFNVASLTDVDTGKTNVVYTSAMANNDYAGSHYTNSNAGTTAYEFTNAYAGVLGIDANRTTALIKVAAFSTNTFIDSSQNDVTIVGDLA